MAWIQRLIHLGGSKGVENLRPLRASTDGVSAAKGMSARAFGLEEGARIFQPPSPALAEPPALGHPALDEDFLEVKVADGSIVMFRLSDIVMLHLTDPDQAPPGVSTEALFTSAQRVVVQVSHVRFRGSQALYPCGLQRRFFASWGGCMGKWPSAPQTRMVPWDAFLRAAVRLCKAPGFQSAPLTRMVEPFRYPGNPHPRECVHWQPTECASMGG
jgi:hypothetical protein